MRIALFSDEYLPFSTRVHAKMLHELALEMKANGHQVVVVSPGSSDQKSLLVLDSLDGIEVWRFRNGRIHGAGKVKRAINESLLSINAWRAIKDFVRQKPFDLCINYSPSIFFGPLAARFKKYGASVYLILRDMFPQWIVDQGIIKESSLVAKYFKYFERLNYNVSDSIGVMSEANRVLFRKLHPEYKNVKVLMNWTDTQPFLGAEHPVDWRKRWGLGDKIVFFYGGNIGHAQDMRNLMHLARSMKCLCNAHFLFVGQGDEFELIKQLKRDWGIKNVTIKPSIPQSQYCELLTQVDVGLISLSSKHSAHNFPGKLLGYMTESLPILGSVNAGNDVTDYINSNNAGFICVTGQDAELRNSAIKLLESSELRTTLGSNARRLLIKHFSVENAAKQILEEFNG